MSSSAPSVAGASPRAMASSAARCCSTTSRATPRPSMPRVSATRARSAACGCRAAGSPPVRRCRSSASLTRSSSSLTALPTVLSSSRLRPARLPRAWSSSASLGMCASRSKAWRSASSAGCGTRACATRNSSWRVGSWLTTPRDSAGRVSSSWARATARAMPAKAPCSAGPGCSAPSRSASAAEASTHSMRRVASWAVFSSIAAAPSARAAASAGAPSSGQAASACSKRSRARTAWSRRWVEGSAEVAGTESGSGPVRSGANSTLSLRPGSPRAARISLSSGSSTIGMSRWPFCRRSR